MYDPDKEFASTLSTWFQVTVHYSPKGILGVDCESNWVKERKICPRQVISDGQTDGETDHYRVSADWRPSKRKKTKKLQFKSLDQIFSTFGKWLKMSMNV